MGSVFDNRVDVRPESQFERHLSHLPAMLRIALQADVTCLSALRFPHLPNYSFIFEK
jgi:hypothetical protein